jgi:signal transduction histidine kinase
LKDVIAFERTELESWKLQETIFCILQLIVLALLLVIHILFATHFGIPSRGLVELLAGAFLVRVLQLIGVQGATEVPPASLATTLTGASVVLNLILAFVAAQLTDRADSQYFVLLVMPVIEAAFRFRLPAAVAVFIAAGALNFAWIEHFARKHGPVPLTEYFEAGSISMIYAFVGALVWILVRNLRSHQESLSRNLLVLRQTQDELVREQKLAAVGRLSAAIAHEIRNPVAMISSSLATALRGQLEPDQRERMFDIAAKQTDRLEKLTNEFLAYARPSPLVIASNDLRRMVSYVAELCNARAAEHDLKLEVESCERLELDCDANRLQQALLNLLTNAIDASPPGSTIRIAVRGSESGVNIEVENSGPPITTDALEHIFEPFFTTKPAGTGLGLAIAKNIAQSHGGDLKLSCNGTPVVKFTLSLPAAKAALALAAEE